MAENHWFTKADRPGNHMLIGLRLSLSAAGYERTSECDQLHGDRLYSNELWSVGKRSLILQVVTIAKGNRRGEVVHFEPFLSLNAKRMDNLLDAIKLYAECPTEDASWLAVVRRLRQKTAAIKDVLLGKPKGDPGGNRETNGIDIVTMGEARNPIVANGIVRRWSEVLQLALREEYREPGQ